jgi:hypothetical protein
MERLFDDRLSIGNVILCDFLFTEDLDRLSICCQHLLFALMTQNKWTGNLKYYYLFRSCPPGKIGYISFRVQHRDYWRPLASFPVWNLYKISLWFFVQDPEFVSKQHILQKKTLAALVSMNRAREGKVMSYEYRARGRKVMSYEYHPTGSASLSRIDDLPFGSIKDYLLPAIVYSKYKKHQRKPRVNFKSKIQKQKKFSHSFR